MTNVSHGPEAAASGRSEPPALVLLEPEIATNAAAAIRLAACLDVPLHVVEPTGFVFDRKRLRRVALDYADQARLTRHPSIAAFDGWRRKAGRRLILMTTRGSVDHVAAGYQPGDLLMLGRESSGAPPEVHERADLRVRVPMAAGMRSLNLVTAAAIVLGEALRQLDAFPERCAEDEGEADLGVARSAAITAPDTHARKDR